MIPTSNHPQRPIPAFAPARGGDDLDAARAFVDASVDGMRCLRVDEMDEVHGWLDAVERGARSLQARAISRAVEAARSDVGTSRIVDTIASVGSLIGQYEMGLVDVEVQIQAGERVMPPEDDMFAPTPDPVTVPPETEARFAEARRLLESLMPVIETSPHQEALGRLLAFEPTAGLGAGPTEHAAASVGPTVDVEAFLPGFVDHAVASARTAGKTVTASYVTDGARIPATLAEEWTAAIHTAIGELVLTTVEAPERRRERGQTAAAHLSIRAESAGNGSVTLRFDCPGARAPVFDVDPPHSVETGQADGTVWVMFTVRPETHTHGTAA